MTNCATPARTASSVSAPRDRGRRRSQRRSSLALWTRRRRRGQRDGRSPIHRTRGIGRTLGDKQTRSRDVKLHGVVRSRSVCRRSRASCRRAIQSMFTTVQAAEVGVPRKVLSCLVASGPIERRAQGVYRTAGAPAADYEVDAISIRWLALGGARTTSANTAPASRASTIPSWGTSI